MVAELQEKRLGRARRRREGLRPDPAGRAAARGRVPRADAPLSRRPALDRAARAARRAPARGAGRARAPGPARADRGAGRVGAGRSATTRWPCTRRCWSSTPADLRAHRALDRHYAARERWRDLENAARHARRVRLRRPRWRSWSSVAPSCARATSRTYGGALDLLEQIVKTAPNHEGARRLLEKLVALPEHRQRVAKILEPVYESSSAWARLVAILEVEREVLNGPRRPRCWRASPTCRRTSCRRSGAALATWRQVLAADPGNPDALPEIERLGDGAGALLRAGRRLPGAGVQAATPPTSPAAPTCCRGRRSSTPGVSATGAPRSTSGSWS